MNPVCIIMIAPFDLGGKGLYRYTYRMTCEESPDLELGDEAVRIFLNTQRTHPELVSPELVELLRYFEDTSSSVSEQCKSPRIKEKLQKRFALTAHEADAYFTRFSDIKE